MFNILEKAGFFFLLVLDCYIKLYKNTGLFAIGGT